MCDLEKVIIMIFSKKHAMKRYLLIITLWGAVFPSISLASFVSMQTVLGDINIEIFDDVAPNTAANFLNYVNDGDYNNSFFHRSVPGFVLQGGGFRYNSNAYSYVPTDPSIANEFSLSNIRGTIAMAKFGSDPDSATSQWFFNLGDNSANLDIQNGGFTVFGRVVEGMDVVDSIARVVTITRRGMRDTPAESVVIKSARVVCD